MEEWFCFLTHLVVKRIRTTHISWPYIMPTITITFNGPNSLPVCLFQLNVSRYAHMKIVYASRTKGMDIILNSVVTVLNSLIESFSLNLHPAYIGYLCSFLHVFPVATVLSWLFFNTLQE